MASRAKKPNVIGLLVVALAIIAILLYMTLWKGMSLSDIGSEMMDRAPGGSRGATERLVN